MVEAAIVATSRDERTEHEGNGDPSTEVKQQQVNIYLVCLPIIVC